jgi:hypothetical protein
MQKLIELYKQTTDLEIKNDILALQSRINDLQWNIRNKLLTNENIAIEKAQIEQSFIYFTNLKS